MDMVRSMTTTNSWLSHEFRNDLHVIKPCLCLQQQKEDVVNVFASVYLYL